MISLRELRIGCWISHSSNHKFIVGEIRTEYVYELLWHDKFLISELDGIEITEEILFKAGFVQLENYQQGMLGLKGVRVCEHLGDWHWNDFSRNKKLTSLHQLQNLFYALTGEEIEIKL